MPTLSRFLTQQGLLPSPTLLGASSLYPATSHIHVGVSANGPMLYLPFNPVRKSRSREEARDDNNDLEDEEGDADQSDGETGDTVPNGTSHERTRDLHHSVTSHTFAVVVKVDKPTDLTPIVRANYHTDAAVQWTGNERSRRPPFNDRFRVSENINWDLDLTAPDAFIPHKEAKHQTTIDDQLLGFEDDDDSSCDADHLLADNMSALSCNPDGDHIHYGPESAKQSIKTYVPLEARNYVPEAGGLKSLDDKSHVERNLFAGGAIPAPTTVAAGTYVFLLPIVFPLQTPESVDIPNGSIVHKLDIQILLPPKRDLRVPPSVALSTSPGHHFNNTWNDEDTGSKSSILKRIGIRRGSNASSSSKMATSPPSMSKLPTPFGAVPFGTTPFDTSRRSSVTKIEDRLVNYSYVLPAIRLPPSDATSTLNKSIYVNKVWNKSLGYEIVLPQKYTMLTAPERVMRKQESYEKRKGSISKKGNHMHKHTVDLQVKLVPLVKGVQLKRIKVNVVEKVTYTGLEPPAPTSLPKSVPLSSSANIGSGLSHNSNAEANGTTGSGAAAGCKKNIHSRVKERTVPLYEIHTKPSSKRAFMPPLYTQSIKSCKNDNLLTFCYGAESKPKAGLGGKFAKLLDGKDEDIIISNPIKLDVPITFVANDERRSIEGVWDWLNKAEEFNEGDELEFGMATIDDWGRRGSITTMRSRVGSITSLGSMGSAGTGPTGLGLGVGTRPRAGTGGTTSDLPVIGTPNTVIPSIVTTNDSGVQGSAPSSLPASHQESFLSGMFGHHGHNSQHPAPVAVEETPRKEVYSFFPDVTFSNLKVRHRLQLGLRISKPDENVTLADGTPKMHHYEVIVDTPIAFMSPLVDGEGDLPSYESVVGGCEMESTISTVSSSDREVTPQAVLQPSSPLMSNTGPLMGYNNPPGYSQTSVSNSSFELSPVSTRGPMLTVPTPPVGTAASLLSSALRRGGTAVVPSRTSSGEFSLDSLLGRNASKSSIEFQRRMDQEQQPPAYEDAVQGPGMERVGLLSDQSSKNESDNGESEPGEGDDAMSLWTDILVVEPQP